MTVVQAKAVHDLVLATKPDHEHEPCALCDDLEETVGDKTYTDEELAAAVEAAKAEAVAAAVAEAVAPVQAELDTLKAAQADTEVGVAIAAAIAPLEAQVADLETELATATAAATAATEARDALQATIDAAVEAEAIAERKDERVQAVKDLEFWTDDFIDKNADDFAALTDEAWDEKLAELADLRDNARTTVTSTPPRGRSAFTASAGDGKPTESATAKLMRRQRDLMNSAPSGN